MWLVAMILNSAIKTPLLQKALLDSAIPEGANKICKKIGAIPKYRKWGRVCKGTTNG